MSKNAIKNCKRARMYALAYKGTNALTIQYQTLQTNESRIVEYSNKPLNIEFNGIKQLKDYYNIKSISSIPQHLMIKESRPTFNGKRERIYKLALSSKFWQSFYFIF